MTTHTPGPWKAVRSVYGDKLAVVGPANDGKHTTSDRICNLPKRGGEGEHNLHLVAAAPDLLEALRAMVAANVPGHGVPMTDAMREAYINARAVLAKAEGA
jgi:hypothetical protein